MTKKYKVTNKKVQTISLYTTDKKRIILRTGESGITDVMPQSMANVIVEEIKEQEEKIKTIKVK